LFGVVVGVLGGVLFGSLSGMRTVIVPYSVALSFTSSAVIGVFFGYLPAKKAAELDPIEALRHE
jgi:putative ABC transport system permease protein